MSRGFDIFQGQGTGNISNSVKYKSLESHEKPVKIILKDTLYILICSIAYGYDLLS